MNLSSTMKSAQIVLGEAMTTNDCDIVASFADSSILGFILGDTEISSNGTTPVTVVAAPSEQVQRQVKEVRLFNKDTVTHTVTLQIFDGTNTWVVAPGVVSVPAGGAFVYTPEAGITVNGTGGGGGGSSLTVEDDTGHSVTATGTLQMVGVIVSGSTPNAITNMTTITGPAGIGAAQGVSLDFRGGAAGTGASTIKAGDASLYGGTAGTYVGSASYGGGVQLVAASGGYGASSYGGLVFITGGAGGNGTSTANAGGLTLRGGQGGTYAPGGMGGGFNLYAGNSYGTAQGASVNLNSGAGFGTGGGGDVKFNVGYTAPGSPVGKFIFNSDPSLIVAAYSWTAGAQLNNQTIFTTTRAMLVTAVIGRPDAVNGTPATLVIVKAASGTAPGAGTPLTSTSMDLTGTPDTNQTLTLSATLTDIQLAAGDSLCMVTTGTLATSAGCITVWGTPQ